MSYHTIIFENAYHFIVWKYNKARSSFGTFLAPQYFAEEFLLLATNKSTIYSMSASCVTFTEYDDDLNSNPNNVQIVSKYGKGK